MASTIQITVYSITELDQKAVEQAYNNWLTSFEYFSGDENKHTLDKFAELFPIKISNWGYGGDRNDGVSYSFTGNSDIESLSGLRLAKYIWNNYGYALFKGKYYYKTSNPKHRYSKITLENSCVLTGYYLDDEILAPIYSFLAKPDKHTTFEDLMDDCFHSWVKACNADMEYSTSLQAFKEDSEANEMQFFANGKTVSL